MRRSVVLGLIAIAAVLAFTAASLAAADDVLGAGTYTAKIKTLSCGGCGPLVKKTLQDMKGIESATVDSKASTVQFVVKKDNSVKVADVQAALKAAAEKMGMGADYTLSDIKAKK